MRLEDRSVTIPALVGVHIQGVDAEMDIFADRFFWARHRAGIGAPSIAKKIGCSSSLITNIEKLNARSSKFNDKLARLFGVDPVWLRTGEGQIPDGYDPREAVRLRKQGASGGEVIEMAAYREPAPRWANANQAPALADDASDEERAEFLQRRLISDFQDYVKLIGPAKAEGFIKLLQNLSGYVSAPDVEKPQRNDE